MLICITGKIGSGKTTALKYINKLGYKTYEADKFIKEIYKKDEIGYKAIKKTFGNKYVSSTKVRRKELGKLVFSDSKELIRLNNLIIPILAKWIKTIKTKPFAIIELGIYGSYPDRFENLFDKIIFLIGKEEIQLNKIKNKKWKNIDKTIKNYKKPSKDWIIVNNNSTKIKLNKNLVKILFRCKKT